MRKHRNPMTYRGQRRTLWKRVNDARPKGQKRIPWSEFNFKYAKQWR